MTRPVSLLILLSLLALPLACRATEPVAEADAPGAGLPYPPAERPTPGQIFHVATGLALSFDGMMDMVSGARLVFIGESHDNMQAHIVQLQILRDLERRFPGRIALGMEMFRQPQQPALDRWTRGELTELEFLEATDWRNTWRYDFGYYRAILEFARDEHIDIVALNPPQALQDQVRQLGLEDLPEEARAQLPEMGEPDPYQHAAMKAIYGGHIPTEGAFERFFDIQRLWEESMAESVVDYLRSPRGQGRIMVTLTGGGHVQYGYGLPKKVLRRMPLPYAIIEPAEIEVPPEKRMPNVDFPDIPLLPADFVWWVPYEELPASTVRLGVGIDDRGGALLVQSVEPGLPAARSGIVVGDEIIAVAGEPVRTVNALVYWVQQQTPGVQAAVTVRRAGSPVEVAVEF